VWIFYFKKTIGGRVLSETVYQEKVMEVEPFGVEKIPKEERHGGDKKSFGSSQKIRFYTTYL
jgi:hypothetical protein